MNAAENKMMDRLSELNSYQLKDVISKLMGDYSDESTIVMEYAMEVLERKIGNKEFIRFAETL